jgi:hypothetical protein
MTTLPVPKRAWLVAIAAAVLAVPSAGAATLGSPPVTAGGGALVECSIANLTGSSAKVTITVIDNDAELAHAGPAPLAGHKSRSATAFCKGICNRPRCEFATDKPAGGFRASACVADHTSTNTSKVCLPAP